MSEVTNKYMVGTEGNPDYLVVACSKGKALGVKPLISPVGPFGELGVVIGVRIRVQNASPYVLEEVAKSNVTDISNGTSFNDAYPSIEFDEGKVTDTRASVMIGVHIREVVACPEELKKRIERGDFLNKIVRWLDKKVPVGRFTSGREVMFDYLKKGYIELVDEGDITSKVDDDYYDKARAEYFRDIFEILKNKVMGHLEGSHVNLKVVEDSYDSDD